MKNAKIDIIERIFFDFAQTDEYLLKINKTNISNMDIELFSELMKAYPKKNKQYNEISNLISDIDLEYEKFGFINGFEYAFNLCKKFM